MNKILVLYHANCPDGFAAAWAAWTVLKDDATYLPMKYGGSFNMDATQFGGIYIVDFSLPAALLWDWYHGGVSYCLLDHHKTAIENLKGVPGCQLDINHSGAVLAWNWFHPDEPVPVLLEYVEDRDLWKWDLPNSREINAAMRLYSRTFESFDELVRGGVTKQMIASGRTMLAFQQQLVEQITAKPIFRKIAGHMVPSVNSSIFQSEITEELCRRYPGLPFSVCWYQRDDYKWVWRFTSRGDFDVSEIARQYGGGGHKNAAGAETLSDINE